MATSPPERIPLHDIVQQLAQDIRSELPAEIRLRRQIEARDLIARGDAATLRSLIRRLVESAIGGLIPEGGTLELSLIAVDVDDARFAARRGLDRGHYARLGLRILHVETDDGHRVLIGAAAKELGDPHLTALSGELEEIHGHLVCHVLSGQLQILHVYIAVEPAARSEGREPIRGCGTVLFVDDDDALVDIHRRSIESLGYEVIECTESMRALELVGRQPDAFDIVISDLGMPDMRGDELARRIRSVSPDLPIGLSTGLAVASGDGAEAGDEFEILLAKPFSLEELAEALDTLRRGRRMARRDESAG